MNVYTEALKRLLLSDPLPKLCLERMQRMMAKLGNPENTYPTFHVAGTNGKGSTCAFLESILREAGFRVGLYTSPHLSCARERIQINRQLIDEADFARLEQQIPKEGTFFERMTAMAFQYFAEQRVDVAVIEVGLGGRLDATNVLKKPLVCGISRIDLDHQEFLGNTLEDIRREKEGIIKVGVPVCRMRPVEKIFGTLGLLGSHQAENAQLAVDMIEASGLLVSKQTIEDGLAETKWPGRLEWLKPNLLIDGAHNPGGMQALLRALKENCLKPEVLWVGLTQGHDIQSMAAVWKEFFPNVRVWPAQSDSARALPREQVAQIFEERGFLVEKPQNCEDKLIVATGSLYWAGKLRAQVLNVPIDDIQMHY